MRAASLWACSETGTRRDAVAVEQHARVPRVLGEHEVRLAQHAQRAQRHVLEVPDRRRDDVQDAPSPVAAPGYSRVAGPPRRFAHAALGDQAVTSRAGVTSKA